MGRIGRISRVLVANRGEIASRVIRSLRAMGLESVAVYSDVDKGAPHVALADFAHALEGVTPAETYLNIGKLIEVARKTGANAVHPGYGFLAENPDFRRACDDAGVAFIGPSAKAMELMGNKLVARRVMRDAGVPVVPGSMDSTADVDQALRDARTAGFPVMLKAAAGGGGKGMRLLADEGSLRSAFESAAREAAGAFGDGSLYVEKFLAGPRHVEVQVLGDGQGNVIHLFERECSVQRRHQKVVEETPAQNLPAVVRDRMCEVAVRAAQAIDYLGAGTMEFLVDAHLDFYFLEMNTRLQVEHPITEAVLGVDLVQAMVETVAERSLSLPQGQLEQRGHAIECRVYAEDPYNDFLPSPGRLLVYRRPCGPFVRVDDGVEQGMEVTAHYDPMLAKVITWAPSREECIKRMLAALEEYVIVGPEHNIPFLEHVLGSQEFISGRYDTGIVARVGLPEPAQLSEVQTAVLAAAAHLASIGQRREGASSATVQGPSSAWKAWLVGPWRWRG